MPFEFEVKWKIPEDKAGGIDQSDDAEVLFNVTATQVEDNRLATNVVLVVDLNEPEFKKHKQETRTPTEPNKRIGIYADAVDPQLPEWREFVDAAADREPNVEGYSVGKTQGYPLGVDFKQKGDSVTKAIVLKTGRTLLRGPAYSGSYAVNCWIDYATLPIEVNPDPQPPVPVCPLTFDVQPD